MYAIVNIAGQQFKVEKDQQILVHRLEAEEGKNIDFNDVVLVDDKGKVKIGMPTLKGASVSAKVISHLRGDKVIIFKRKDEKGIRNKQVTDKISQKFKSNQLKYNFELRILNFGLIRNQKSEIRN